MNSKRDDNDDDISLIIFFSFLSLPRHIHTLNGTSTPSNTPQLDCRLREIDASLHTFHCEGREKNEGEIIMLFLSLVMI